MDGYDEYEVPKTKEVIKWHIDVNLILGWIFGIIVVCAAIFGIACAALSADKLELGDKVSDDCYYIHNVTRNTWEPDVDNSGVYCKE